MLVLQKKNCLLYNQFYNYVLQHVFMSSSSMEEDVVLVTFW